MKVLFIGGIILVLVASGFAFKAINQNSGQIKIGIQNTQQAKGTSPTEPETVQLSPFSSNHNKYAGSNYVAIIPSHWTVTRNTATTCGEEMDEEDLTIMIPTTNAETTNTLSVCTEKPKPSSSHFSYDKEKASLQTSFANGLFDTLNEKIIDNHHALTYDFERKDFPGYYEKTIIVPESTLLYRISWNIHAKDATTMNEIKTATEPQYNAFIASFLLNH